MKNSNYKVEMVVWDGGPCSGKSTGLSIASERLIKQNIIPLFVPESATLLIANGITPKNLGMVNFQKAVLEMQISNEILFQNRAEFLANKYKKNAVVICDRGILSGIAYLNGDNPIHEFRKFLEPYNMDIEDVRARYNSVLILRTAADGAVESYTRANNKARSENIHKAILQCDRTRDLCWIGHPHVAQILNTANGEKISFEEKIDLAVKEMFRHLGLPAPLEIEDKFLLQYFNPEKLKKYGVKTEAVEIEQNYLLSDVPNEEERVRMRSWFDSHSFFHNTKIKSSDHPEGRLESDRHIDSKLYLNLLRRKDHTKRSIKKTRYHFLYEGQYFEADVFQNQHEGLFILERERGLDSPTNLPNFLKVVKEITGDSAYSNYALASR